MVFQNCVDLLRSDPGSCSDTFDVGNQVVGIKVEEDPLRTIKSEPEVSLTF
jgi:hypothetical protein